MNRLTHTLTLTLSLCAALGCQPDSPPAVEGVPTEVGPAEVEPADAGPADAVSTAPDAVPEAEPTDAVSSVPEAAPEPVSSPAVVPVQDAVPIPEEPKAKAEEGGLAGGGALGTGLGGGGSAAGLGGLGTRGFGSGRSGYGSGGGSFGVRGRVAPVLRNTEAYRDYGVNETTLVADDPLSTFSIDVDTASYTVARRKLSGGHLPPVAAVRVEEFVNTSATTTSDPIGARPSPWTSRRHPTRGCRATTCSGSGCRAWSTLQPTAGPST